MRHSERRAAARRAAARRGKARSEESPPIKICTHIILGLPGETIEMMHQTVEEIAKLPIDGLKIHLLHVIKNTKLHEEYLKGEVPIFEEDAYVTLVCDLLEKIPSHIIIQRLTGEAESEKLIAPRWVLNKSQVLQKIHKTLEKRATFQGSKSNELAII